MSSKTASKEKQIERLQAKLEELEEKVKRNSLSIHNISLNGNISTY